MQRIRLTHLQKQIVKLLGQNKVYTEIATELDLTAEQTALIVRSLFCVITFEKLNAELAAKSFHESLLN